MITEVLDFLKWVGTEFGFIKMVIILTFVIIISAFLYKARKPHFAEKTSLWLKKRANKTTKDKLRKHPIFAKHLLYKYRIKSVVYSGKYYKTQLLQLFFKTKIDVDVKTLKYFLNSEIKKSSRFYLQTLMTDAVQDMKEKFDIITKQKLKKLVVTQTDVFRKDYTIDELNIFVNKLFDYIMYEKGGYEEKRVERVSGIYKQIQDIPLNPIYNNNYERIYRFFDIIDFNIDNIIVDAMEVYEKFNGQIDHMMNGFIMKNHKNEL